MKLSTFFLIILVIFSFVKLNSAEKNEELKNKITKNIRCLICQGQSVYDSQSDFSESVKLIIENKLNEGLSENEIYDFLINKYGEWISYDPKFNKKTYILWILPILLFALGGAIIVRKLIIQKL
tara:strand:- start:744 stop:1115 length:372 start_codon:yes stop_codon:yes gene_type:complete